MSLFLFIFFLLLAAGILFFKIIWYIITKIRNNNVENFFDFLFNCFFKKEIFTPLLLALGILIMASIVPYLMQQHDYALITSYAANTELYNRYIKEYSDAAQKQIEEYEKAKSELVKLANPTQLQYWSQQIDTVGNQLTDKIKWFKDKIMEQEIATNEASARITMRSTNKWYFGIE